MTQPTLGRIKKLGKEEQLEENVATVVQEEKTSESKVEWSL